MVVIEDYKKLDSAKIMEKFGEKRLSFVREEYMMQKISLTPGHVSPLALLNNLENDIHVIFDESIRGTMVWFHPWRNDNTVILNLDDVEKYIREVGNEFEYLDL